MTDLQKKLLEMLKWLTTFIDQHGLRYYVVGGTLLGAVRHQGFIPWDDDIDIGLPRPDYLKLVGLLKEQKDHYRLESPYEGNNDFLYTSSKFYDIDTTLIEHQRKNIKRGVYIDVFPLDGAGNSIEEAISYSKSITKKNNFLMGRICAIRKERKWYKNFFIIMTRCLPFINNKKLSLRVDKMASKKDYDSSLYVSNFSGSYGTKEIFEKRVFGKPTYYQFEDFKVKGPELYEEYLTHLYGDWRKLPPVEKRGIQHDNIAVDLKKSYLDK